jgi:hypothetical protein
MFVKTYLFITTYITCPCYFFALLKGRRKLVEGFVRWCHRSDKKVGLNQKIDVINVAYDEEPTGLYDAFYCRIK